MCDFSKYVVKDNITIREALVALNRLSDDLLVLFVVNQKNSLGGNFNRW